MAGKRSDPPPKLTHGSGARRGSDADATFGPWTVVATSAEGSVGRVAKAIHANGTPGALKWAKAGVSAERAVRREARLLAYVGACLDCRWMPKILDVGVDRERTYVVTTWIEGTSLAHAKPPTAATDRVRRTLEIAHGLARSLAELHMVGVRHGDVKPANVIVLPRSVRRDAPEDRAATLVDFGLGEGTGTTGTVPGPDAFAVLPHTFAGATPRYAAPEILRGAERGPKADLFALGVTLAEFLDPDLGRDIDPGARIRTADFARGVDAPVLVAFLRSLVSGTPGARPSAESFADWIGAALGLDVDPGSKARERESAVRRTYLALRSDVWSSSRVDGSRLPATTRAWIDEANAIAGVALAPRGNDAPITVPEPLGPTDLTRWAVALVGPAASAWTATLASMGESDVADAFVRMAGTAAPEAWFATDLTGHRTPRPSMPETVGRWDAAPVDAENLVRATSELARPDASAAVVTWALRAVFAGTHVAPLAHAVADALVRAGDPGRAYVALVGRTDEGSLARLADLERRRGDAAAARRASSSIQDSADPDIRSRARAVLARLAWDEGDFDGASRLVEGDGSAAAVEIRGLVDYALRRFDAGLARLDANPVSPTDVVGSARLLGVRGLLAHGLGDSEAAFDAFAAATELAARASLAVEEATYRTGEAAAAVDVGRVDRAIESSRRAALVWERLGRPNDAARAWLAHAGALAMVGATSEAALAAERAESRAEDSGDRTCALYARLVLADVLAADDPRRASVVESLAIDRASPRTSDDDRVRIAARLGTGDVDDRATTATSAAALEYWASRAERLAKESASDGDDASRVATALLALTGAVAPVGAKGAALHAGVLLAARAGEHEVARRFETERARLAARVERHTPPARRSTLLAVPWIAGARAASAATTSTEWRLEPSQLASFDAIVRSLAVRDGSKALLGQILDALLLWTTAPRGMILLRAPGGRLVPRVARNLAKESLTGPHLAFSRSIAERALSTGEPVLATDALAATEDLRASVHALGLQSVLAVPLVARGAVLGVVYLDDTTRPAAFGASDLAWVRMLAGIAAMALADARDNVLLARAARKSARAERRIQELLARTEAELDTTKGALAFARGSGDTRHAYPGIQGRSAAMRALLSALDKITEADVPVLVTGESGTGKELVARAIHDNGPRRRGTFVGENCGAVPETLLESTLFGHVRGAFTGAVSTRTGLFDLADGGTLFLDEVAEMSLGMQVKLLRVLEDGEVRAVGSVRSRKVDVRVIAATHEDLAKCVERGTFREDLYYRLAVVTVTVPALRDRKEDIPILVRHFEERHGEGKSLRFTRRALARLVDHGWPGNVRQLENELRRLLVLAGDRIDVDDLSEEVRGDVRTHGSLTLKGRVDALETELVRAALRETGGNQSRAAKVLGVSRFGLQKMMKRLSIEP
ncbi:MAG: sigma 54-interacting transcriptional regulator [Polyangiaceae bacterium]